MIDYNNGFAVHALFDIHPIYPNVLPSSLLTLVADSLFIWLLSCMYTNRNHTGYIMRTKKEMSVD